MFRELGSAASPNLRTLRMEHLIPACSFVYWCAMAGLLRRVCARVPLLRDLDAPPPETWPSVSLVVPARDEADTLVPALRSKLELPYPNLEVVLVDDRSTDATPRLAREMAATYPALSVVRVDHLPSGWLGKVHAMQRGVERAAGEWLLFCDADVHIEAETLQRVVAYAEREHIDHVTMLPRITTTGPVLVGALSTFLRQLCVGGRLGDVEDPRSSAAVGIGAFNLVRRGAFERIAGFAQLRMEINDDVELGRLLKRSGARQCVVNGCTGLALEFFPSFQAMTRSLEKNGGTVSPWVLLSGLAVLLLLEMGFLGGFVGATPWMTGLALATWAIAAAVTLRFTRWLALPRWPAAVPFLGVLPLCWALGRAGVLAWSRGGVVWRGTFYPRGKLPPLQTAPSSASPPMREASP